MKKRFLSFFVCILLTVSLFSSAVSAGSMNSAALPAQSLQVKKITPSVTLSTTSTVWSGKAKKPGVTVKAGSVLLQKDRDYTVSYKNNINVGKATVTVTLKGKYKGSKSVSFKILPKGTSLTSLSKTSETMTIKWKRQSEKMSKERITGYQFQLATDRAFTKNKKTVKVAGYQNTSKKVKGLKPATKYFVRIRTYKTIGDKTFYSKWSDLKSKKDPVEEPIVTPEPLEGFSVTLGPNDAFLLDAVSETCENAIISPLSINLVLSMLLEGAEGETREELETYLGVPKDQLDNYVQNILSSTADEENLKMLLSNAFWYRFNQNVEDSYKTTLAERYGAEISDMDFYDPAGAAEIINGWCSKKTFGLIPSIVGEDDLIDAADVLLNTLYFKNDWQEPVEDYAIKDGIFHGYTQDIKVKYLHSSETKAYENDFAIAFEKPYNKGYSFIGILPKAEGEFNFFDLDIPGLLQNRVSGYNSISAVMPKFDLESGGDITEILNRFGLNNTLTPAADFSGIAPDVYVSKIIHKTKMILDENGTEAAAATAAVTKESAVPFEQKVLKIVLDRPYAFIIADRQNGNILFMGKVCNPVP